MHFDDELIFLARPLSADNARIENVVPSFAALTTKSSRQMLSNYDPVLGTELLDLMFEDFVFGRGPETASIDSLRRNASLALIWRVIVSNQLFYLLPPLEAPDLSLVGHELADPVPRVLAEHLDQLRQLLVLLLCPENFLNWCLADSLSFPPDPLSGLVLANFSGQDVDQGFLIDEGKLALELGRLLSECTVLEAFAYQV